MRPETTRLTRYLATASAAAAGVATAPAQAAVVTSTSVAWAGWSGSITASNPGIVAAPSFGTAFPGFSRLGGGIVSYGPGGRFAVFTYNTGAGAVSGRVGQTLLGAGAVIGAAMTANQWNGTAYLAKSFGSNVGFRPSGGMLSQGAGAGADSVSGYLAFRIDGGFGAFYYGYFEFSVSRTGIGATSTLSMSITGWAYDNTLNQSITIPNPSAVPGGAGLAALACGAAGLRGRRRVA